ncbi:MAG: hypothetical protein KDI13_09060 [Alphaproteobacteria bacterium]|nr:hypothetical protein [Alphaproteobacteria bacterium]
MSGQNFMRVIPAEKRDGGVPKQDGLKARLRAAASMARDQDPYGATPETYCAQDLSDQALVPDVE